MNVSRLAAPAVVLFGVAAYMALRYRAGDQAAVELNLEESAEVAQETPEELAAAHPENSSDPSAGSSEPSTGAPIVPDPEQPRIANIQVPSNTLPETIIPPPNGDTITTPPNERELRRIGFLEGHVGLNVPELRGERDALQTKIDNLKEAAVELRFSQNNFDIAYPGDAPQLPPPLGPGNRKVLTEVRTTVDPDTLQVSAHIVELPFDEYPELYALIDETEWLTDLIGD